MEYRRCQGKSYMIRRMEKPEYGYQFSMLKENRVQGLLPADRVQEGEEVQFWYDISGKHDLEGYARFHKLGRNFLENFIFSLYRVSQNLGKYLLLEDELSLEPDMIFMHNKEISFCYVPGNKKSLENSLGNFMEFFLKHMEHGTQRDIEICYKVYELTQEEHVDFSELAELIGEDSRGGEKIGEAADFMEIGEGPINLEESLKDKEKEKHCFSLEGIFGKKQLLSNLWRQRKKRQEEEEFFFEPEESFEEASNPTVFLGSERKEIFGELRYEGDGRGKNFKIDTPVFLVGSQEGEANGVIFTSSVSRRHALITKEEENYYIEDLNSTNGTYLNGEALEYKEKVPLSKNDKIMFAEEKYRFV